MSLILEVDQNFPQPGIVEQAIEVVNATDGVFVYPQTRFMALDAKLITRRESLSFTKLRRDEQKSFSVMFKDLRQLKAYAKIGKREEVVLRKYLPGPFTFILKATSKTPKELLGPDKTIGIRIPGNKLCLALIKEAKVPIITTSLNISGRRVLTEVEEIPDIMLKEIDLILDAGTLGNQSSTVVDLTKKKPVILRQGRVVIPELGITNNE